MTQQEAGANLTLEALRDHVRPTPADTPWLEIPWIPDLWDGALVAREQGRPMFLWAMNGHPLGCV